MRRSWISIAAAAIAAVAGCAGAGGAKGPQVSDVDFGRLAPDQMGPVDEARQYVASARDELARAKLRLQESQHEAELAKADGAVLKADEDRANAISSIANQSRDPVELERARQLQQRVQLQKSSSDAHAAYASKLVEADRASLDAANRQVELAEARLELAKLQALIQGNVPAATKYDLARFQAHVNDDQKAFQDALARARGLQAQASASRQKWQNAQIQMQASGGAIQTG